MRYLSPLRYPGGKGRLAPYIARLLASQNPRPHAYAEPFAGGAGAALRLLVDEEVRVIYINDLSPGIAAFWRCVFEHTDALTDRVRMEPVDLDAWHAARAIYEHPEGQDDLALGFATFFLNRCNRSGILGARPIGGLDQTGRWKIDARFNRTNLVERIQMLGGYRDRVHISQLDARDFLRTMEPQGSQVLVYVDPPYLVQGEDLYLDSLRPEDHIELAELLRSSDLPWFLTYDIHEQITTDLYGGLRTAEFDIAHTAQKQHVGAEYAVFSDELVIPGIDMMRRGESRWIGSSAPASQSS